MMKYNDKRRECVTGYSLWGIETQRHVDGDELGSSQLCHAWMSAWLLSHFPTSPPQNTPLKGTHFTSSLQHYGEIFQERYEVHFLLDLERQLEVL